MTFSPRLATLGTSCNLCEETERWLANVETFEDNEGLYTISKSIN